MDDTSLQFLFEAFQMQGHTYKTYKVYFFHILTWGVENPDSVEPQLFWVFKLQLYSADVNDIHVNRDSM